ncbi:TIM barrel protein [Archaeoglobus veneficus]|uniref:Xylose isomerase domain-containing protein TIM barrel n=1 Tax=Archaeoglobus veneficus (strain DSM 11195 / SNP6) TaxID=693661 RepID=F2KNL6_ARCVS|nr:TIM barrel protein [Archaeoglobus veneficus]AEA46244.1 Xylose isomerase domain-containing protein TIM barrel [Archaeoglobus veneficus SNP6]
MPLLFGTAGVPHASKDRSTAGGVKTISELGLDAMEVQFVRGVKMGETKAREVATMSEALGVALSVHAPYYVNLNSEDKFEDSVKRIVDSVRIGSIFNARSIVFHAAYYQKSSKERVYERVRKGIAKVLEYMEQHGIKTILRSETTGKATQFGELDELLRLSQELENVMPCVDFAHIHARYRRYNSYDEFCEILSKVEDVLGKEALKNMHMHVSGIDYGLKGEKAHLNLEESDFKYVELLKALKDFGVEGILICESPNLEEDAMLLKKTYQSL